MVARHGGREAAYAMLLQMASLDSLRERVARVPVPTTVVWGDRDSLMSLDTAERLVELLPEAEVHVVEGCGLALAVERPEALLELIGEHLR